MRFFPSVLFVAVTIAVAACHGGDSDPYGKTVTMAEDLAQASKAAGGDCAKLAASVQTVVDKYRADLPAMKAASTKLDADKAAQADMEKKYGDRMGKVGGDLINMMKCNSEPAFKTAYAPIDGLY